MAIMRMNEIRMLTADEREKKIAELRTELARIRATVRSGGAVDNPGRISEIRRTIARILTVQNESSFRTG